MQGRIATTTWDDCETCKHNNDVTRACELETGITLTLDAFGEDIICDDYEEAKS